MEIKNNLENKAKFFALYWGFKCLRNELLNDNIPALKVDISNCKGLPQQYLELKSLSQISDEDAIEVARILYGESDNFAIEFNAAGITSVSPYGLPCYGNTIDINWSGEVSYEAASSMSILKAYDYLRSKGYALPWMCVDVETLAEWGWVKLRGGEND